MTFYNEFDANAAAWLRNLAAAGEIAHGLVDERSIKEVQPGDLAGVNRAHFFAGIGGWDLALRLAGWPQDEEVWTGSCPCQPFSSAGKGKGIADERHLWPEFLRLIALRLPATIFGEQVASKAGRQWLAGVRADLEALGYRVGAVDLCAAGVGAPHIRQRLYWVAERLHSERWPQHDDRQDGRDGQNCGRQEANGEPGTRGQVCGVVNNDDGRREGQGLSSVGQGSMGKFDAPRPSETCGLADDDERQQRDGRPESGGSPVAVRNSWADFRVVPCTDGKVRRTGARVFPLAYGLPRGVGDGGAWRKGLARGASRARIGILKGAGNAIVPELAAEFIMAYMDAAPPARAGESK